MHLPHLLFLGRQILVTGGLGFIGSALVRRLVEWGADVSIMDKNVPGTGANLFNIEEVREDVTLISADIRDTEAMSTALREKDFLFNLAGLSSHMGGMQDPRDDLEVNAMAQVQILELCRALNPDVRIVFAGTRQVYGRQEKLPVGETACYSPVDYNGVSKLAGELYHLVAHQVHNLWTTSIRMTNTYGPRMRIQDSRQNFIGWWIRQLLEGKPLDVFGDGEQIRDLNYVEDVVDALILSVTNPQAKGKFYNIGAEPIHLTQLARLLVDLHGGGSYRLVPYPRERIPIDIQDYAADYSKINSELGWRPTTDLRAGLQQTLDYYDRNWEHYCK